MPPCAVCYASAAGGLQRARSSGEGAAPGTGRERAGLHQGKPMDCWLNSAQHTPLLPLLRIHCLVQPDFQVVKDGGSC
jgi:hypothetical protein